MNEDVDSGLGRPAIWVCSMSVCDGCKSWVDIRGGHMRPFHGRKRIISLRRAAVSSEGSASISRSVSRVACASAQRAFSSMISRGVLPEAAIAACRSAVALLGDPLGRPDRGRLPPRIWFLSSFILRGVAAALDCDPHYAVDAASQLGVCP